VAGKKYLGPYSDDEDIATKAKLPKYSRIIDSKASGTQGGTFTAGAWRTRVLNTETTDGIGITLASNRFTLPAGTYIIRAEAPGYVVDGHMAALYNYSDSSYVLYGTSENSSVDDRIVTKSVVTGQFTIASAKTFELRHYCDATRADNGFGTTFGLTGVSETFTVVELWKVA
jgi:hypothetical protein